MTKLPWWETDVYSVDDPMPPAFERLAGPKGVALVKAWPDGRTSADWGLAPGKKKDGSMGLGFAAAYAKGQFVPKRILYGYSQGMWAFAYVMRSVRMICIDIDGKNGGLEHVLKLGALPKTLAETSMSGTGYHLFFEMDDEWSDEIGFGLLGDRIGIEQGVDIRATGCVYHHPQQKWNGRAIAKLPAHLFDLLQQRSQQAAAAKQRLSKILASGDELEILMAQDDLLSKLKKPIVDGKRNQTLFAIGSQLFEAGVSNWEQLIRDKGADVGLPQHEIEKLVTNIPAYAGQTVPNLSVS